MLVLYRIGTVRSLPSPTLCGFLSPYLVYRPRKRIFDFSFPESRDVVVSGCNILQKVSVGRM